LGKLFLTMNKNKLFQNPGTSEIILFDAGAKGGTKELKKLAPYAKVFAFEPHPREAESLRKNKLMQQKFSKYFIHDVALSDEGGIAFLNLMNNSSMSSLLEPDFENYQLHFGMMDRFADWKNNITVREKVKVKMETLDSFSSENKISQIDFLKLDTQGTELKILQGAEGLLQNHSISVIKIEVAFVPVYKEQCLFADIDILLRTHHMHFVDCMFYENTIYEKPKMQNHFPLKDAKRFSSGGDAFYVINIEKVNPERKRETALKTGMIMAELNYKSIAFDFLHHHANLEEKAAISLVKFLSAKSLKDTIKQTIKNWCPPKILNALR
jgi:FkbM family methyltransferase